MLQPSIPTQHGSDLDVQPLKSTESTRPLRTDRLNNIRSDIQKDAQKISPQYLSETIVPEGGE